MNKLLKKTSKILLPIALGVFVLYWVYRDFDFMRAKEVLLCGTDWGWMLFSLFFGVMSHVFRGWRWKQTLAPLGAYPKSSDCVDAIFISYAANLVLPRVGEVSRCGVLAKYDDVSFAKSLGTVVTERLIDTLSIVLKLKDGRELDLGYSSGGSVDGAKEETAVFTKSDMLSEIIPLEEMESIVICGTEIPLN